MKLNNDPTMAFLRSNAPIAAIHFKVATPFPSCCRNFISVSYLILFQIYHFYMMHMLQTEKHNSATCRLCCCHSLRGFAA